MKKFLTYHAKWQLGIIVSWPCMYLFSDILGWSNLATVIGFQFVGAIIYYPIDKFIFKKMKGQNAKSIFIIKLYGDFKWK